MTKCADSPWLIVRKKPYTEIGIRRLLCIRCGNPAKFQWNICADDGNYRPLCASCDVALNALVLTWIGCPTELMAKKMLNYVDFVTGGKLDELELEQQQ